MKKKIICAILLCTVCLLYTSKRSRKWKRPWSGWLSGYRPDRYNERPYGKLCGCCDIFHYRLLLCQKQGKRTRCKTVYTQKKESGKGLPKNRGSRRRKRRKKVVMPRWTGLGEGFCKNERGKTRVCLERTSH